MSRFLQLTAPLIRGTMLTGTSLSILVASKCYDLSLVRIIFSVSNIATLLDEDEFLPGGGGAENTDNVLTQHVPVGPLHCQWRVKDV